MIQPQKLHSFRTIAFLLMAVVILLLIAATVAEQLFGTDFAHNYLYASPVSIALWAALVISALLWIVAVRHRVGVATLMIHIAFALILVGALTSHLTSRQGTLHLRMGDGPTNIYDIKGGGKGELPFGVALSNFHIIYYSATSAPMDFVSSITLTDGIAAEISMNNVLSHKGYRFYQSGYDQDMQGTILMVASDAYGIAVTYAGYLLLLLAMIAFLFQRRSGWEALLKSAANHRIALLIAVAMALQLSPTTADAANGKPKTVSPEVAAELGDIYIYHNDRACPLETFARNFTTKVYGSTSYRGMSALQVVAGWLFYYDDWKDEPFIKIKERSVRRLLGGDRAYFSIRQFVDVDGYKLDKAPSDIGYKTLASANEKLDLVSSVATGAALHIYPVSASDGNSVVWYSPADKLPADTPEDEWIFIRKSLNLLAQYIYDNDDRSAIELLRSVKRFQQKSAGEDALPSNRRFNAEKLYNRMPATRYIGMAVLTLGLISYALLLFALVYGRLERRFRNVQRGMFALLVVVFLLITFQIALRWVVSNHLPLTNGFETMQFMAWCCALVAMVLCRQWGTVSLSAGLTVCGFALLVAGLGERNPQITQLMPVLASPLLSLHVVVIMLSYSLLAVCMLNGVAALIVAAFRGVTAESVETLRVVSRVLLTPALFLLTAGIFIGAVWANSSWGTYWSWDPKETWALITLMVYAFALHESSLPMFRRPIVLHIYMVLAFLSVLMTYFGVNYLLGGMHSYAG